MTKPTKDEDKNEKEHSGAADTAGNGRDDSLMGWAVTVRAATVTVAVTIVARRGGCVVRSTRTGSCIACCAETSGGGG